MKRYVGIDLEKLPENSLFRHRPELLDEWDFEENEKDGFKIEKITRGSKKKISWICTKNKHKFKQRPLNRSYNQNCPYCSGRLATENNSLAAVNPEVSKQWHPTKNGDLTPDNIAVRSGQKYWWICDENHEWSATPDGRYNGNGCPYCDKKKIWIGDDDLWTTNPDIAKNLKNKDDGYLYSYGSNTKVDWICPECSLTVRDKKIKSTVLKGVICSSCSPSIKFPERTMSKILNNSGVDFIHNTSFEWSNNKLYDFYLPEYNMIIETHGIQHYIQTNRKGARTISEEQENDRYKEQIAKENGIEHYVIIDCRFSNINHISSSIENSLLIDAIPEILSELKTIREE